MTLGTRLLAQLREEMAYQATLGWHTPPAAELFAEHFVGLLMRQVGLAVEGADCRMTDPVQFRRQLVRAAALAIAGVLLIDEGRQDQHPAGPDQGQRGSGI